jgi:hypothetical protein
VCVPPVVGWIISIISILEEDLLYGYIYISLAQWSSYSTTLVMGTHMVPTRKWREEIVWWWNHHVVCGVPRDGCTTIYQLLTANLQHPTMWPPPSCAAAYGLFPVRSNDWVCDRYHDYYYHTYAPPPSNAPTERLVHMMDTTTTPGNEPNTTLSGYPPEVVGGHA